MPTTSWSKINTGRRCLRAHHFRYNLRIERKRPKVPMLVGKILHEMLDVHTNTLRLASFQGDAWDVLEEYATEYKKFFREEQEEHGDIIANCERLFESYLAKYKDDGLQYEASEAFVATDISPNLRFIGYIDKIAVDPQGRRWIMDHKFHKAIPGPQDRFHELQLVAYVWAWSRWNPEKPIDGVCWDYVRTAPPTLPDVLKNGELSKRKNLRCDRRSYEQEIKRHKLDPKDYQDILSVLDKNETMFFERVFLPAPRKDMIEQVVGDLRSWAVMLEHLGDLAPRSMSKFNCQGCEFRELCEAEIRGQDVNFVRKSKYRKRKNRAEEEDQD